jgi:uncharacterized Zn-binding protein involved in type VI secretion
MGRPAARLSDFHVCPMVSGTVPHVGGPVCGECEPTVLIGGLPAARIGDKLVCMGPTDVIASGAGTVLIGGRPAARLGDSTVHGGTIVMGDFTVLIGDGGGAGSDTSDTDAPPTADPAPAPEEELSAGPMGTLDNTDPAPSEGELSAGPMGTLDNTDPAPSDSLPDGPAQNDAASGSATDTGSASDGAPLQGGVSDNAPLQGGVSENAPLQGFVSANPPSQGPATPNAPVQSMKLFGNVEQTDVITPPPVTLRMPNNWNIEISAPGNADEYKAQVDTGWLQGLSQGLNRVRIKSTAEVIVPDPSKPGVVLDFMQTVTEMFGMANKNVLEAFEKADQVLKITDILKDLPEAQKEAKEWSDFADEYDKGVAEGKYPASPMVRAYANGQMAAIAFDAYKGLIPPPI